jgi:hypothetical protein
LKSNIPPQDGQWEEGGGSTRTRMVFIFASAPSRVKK